MDFTTSQLLAAIKEKGIKLDNFFLRMFFPEVYTFTTEKVDLDLIPNNPKIAPYCSPMVGGQIERNQGFSTASFKAPYVKSKHNVDGSTTLKRLPGEDPTTQKTPAERQALIVMQNLEQEELAIAQREELQAAQMVIYGEYLVDGPNIEEPFMVSSPRKAQNNITLVGSSQWQKQNPDVFDVEAEIEKYAGFADGQINIIVIDKLMWSLLRKFKKFNNKLETRRGSKSELETSLKDLGKTVSHKGSLGDVDIVVVDEEFVDRSGVTQKVMPDYTMILGHTSVRGVRLYGCIQDAKAQQEGFTAAERYVRDWTTHGDPSVRQTKTECAPAMYMIDANSFVVIRSSPKS